MSSCSRTVPRPQVASTRNGWSGRRESNPRMQLGKLAVHKSHQGDSCETEPFRPQSHQRVTAVSQNAARSPATTPCAASSNSSPLPSATRIPASRTTASSRTSPHGSTRRAPGRWLTHQAAARRRPYRGAASQNEARTSGSVARYQVGPPHENPPDRKPVNKAPIQSAQEVGEDARKRHRDLSTLLCVTNSVTKQRFSVRPTDRDFVPCSSRRRHCV